MTSIHEWAERWGVHSDAVADLMRTLTSAYTPHTASGATEGAALSAVRLEASQKGILLFRNNVGAARDARGNHVRFGLANDSKAMNEQLKSSDLIGLRPVLITPQHVGTTIGQFVAREVKRAGWVYKNTDREQAQLRFLQLISAAGGDASFATGEGTL